MSSAGRKQEWIDVERELLNVIGRAEYWHDIHLAIQAIINARAVWEALDARCELLEELTVDPRENVQEVSPSLGDLATDERGLAETSDLPALWLEVFKSRDRWKATHGCAFQGAGVDAEEWRRKGSPRGQGLVP